MPTKAASHPTPRAWANLTISFGLVSVDVAISPLTEDSGVKGKIVCSIHREPAKQRYHCEVGDHDCTDERESAFDYEGQLVSLSTDALESERDGLLHLTSCVDVGEIDPLYFEKSYLVWAKGKSEAAYDLLASALRETGKVALGTCVLTKKTRVLAVRWSDAAGALLAHVCTYDENLRWASVKLVATAIAERPTPDKNMAAMAVEVLDRLDDSFEPETYHDDYQARLREALDAALTGKPAKKSKVAAPAAKSDDLMAALQASVVAAKKKQPGAAAKSSTRKKVTA